MTATRPIHHVVQCFGAADQKWEALTEAGFEHAALIGWACAAEMEIEPPDPVRRAIWEGLTAAGGGLVGFPAERGHIGPGSLWRDTRQGWIARRIKPLPGLIWTTDPETFDSAFGVGWSLGRQPAFALAPGHKVAPLDGSVLAPWLSRSERTPPAFPPGCPLAVRAGVDGALFAVYATGADVLEGFIDAFRKGLDWRYTTFQRVLEPQFGPTLARLSTGRMDATAEMAQPRWFARMENAG